MGFLVLIFQMILAWALMFFISLWDALLVGWFLDASNVAVLESLTYWQLFWLNMAFMMPVGTAIQISRVAAEVN